MGRTTSSGTNRTAAMVSAARELLASVDVEQMADLTGSLGDPRLRDWTYLPGPRPGLSLEHMSASQRTVTLGLVEATLGRYGAVLVTGAIEVERARRELVTGQPVDSDRYWFRLLGDPSGELPWGWRINGHHVAVHTIVVGDRLTVTPLFVGAEPALIRTGPHAERRLLGPEEDLARDLLTALDPDQRSVAVFSATAPDDVLTRADPVANPGLLPAGLWYADMTDSQRQILQRLARRYLDRAPADYAEQCWQQAVGSGLDQISFAWGGGAARGQQHYYCLSAPDFLIEYDNTQDGGNHAHSVWRHLRDDWGVDILREHYSSRHAAGR